MTNNTVVGTMGGPNWTLFGRREAKVILRVEPIVRLFAMGAT